MTRRAERHRAPTPIPPIPRRGRATTGHGVRLAGCGRQWAFGAVRLVSSVSSRSKSESSSNPL
jgi:hypothetical protein